jgi:hypothetical protein
VVLAQARRRGGEVRAYRHNSCQSAQKAHWSLMMHWSRVKVFGVVLLAGLIVAILTNAGVRQRIKRRRMQQEHEVAVESDELLQWLNHQGGVSGKLRIQNFDHAGDLVRGIGATEAIAKGTLVLRVPRSLFVEPGGNSIPPELDKQEVLLAAELGSIFHRSSSQFQRWLEALPSAEELHEFHPLYASNEDLALFSDLPIAMDARNQRTILRDAWTKLRNGKRDKTTLKWEGDFDWGDFFHYFVLQESRRLQLELPHGRDDAPPIETLAVVPIVDMINYSGSGANVAYEMVDENDALGVMATRDILKGEELLLSSKQAGGQHDKKTGADNLDFAYRFGVSLGDNPVATRQLGKDVCEGLLDEIEELHARNDNKHRSRMLFSSLIYEACADMIAPPVRADTSATAVAQPLGRGHDTDIAEANGP